ncbi:MAG: hypothetical protein Q4D03_07295 [Bacteroidales bacterium]|nr:hypothetical protein [Bacteroidales bacterium]
MKKDTAAKIYEWASYIMLLGATVVFFLTSKNVQITLLILVVAVYLRALMYRARYKSYEEENETLKRDLRRLTAALKESEKK